MSASKPRSCDAVARFPADELFCMARSAPRIGRVGREVGPHGFSCSASTWHEQECGSPWHTVGNIVPQLLVPFIAGQLMRPAIGK